MSILRGSGPFQIETEVTSRRAEAFISYATLCYASVRCDLVAVLRLIAGRLRVVRLPLLLGLMLFACRRPTTGASPTPSCGHAAPAKLIGTRRALATDTALMRTKEAGLLVIVDDGRDTTMRRLSDAAAYITGTTIGARTNSSGQALLSRMHDRSVTLIVRHIGYSIWQGQVNVRPGYRDTVEVWLDLDPAVCVNW